MNKRGREGTSTQQRRQELKEALVQAGIRTIETKGLNALRARDLAREANCSLGAIYNVFQDIDMLILTINTATMVLLERHLSKVAKPFQMISGDEAKLQAREQLVALALSYLDFAANNLLRWRALFEHRMQTRHGAPDWYTEEITKLFIFIEQPVQVLVPALDQPERSLLARSLFSAAHGMVSLGLEEKIGTIPFERLNDQIRIVVDTMACGLMMRETTISLDRK